MSILNGYRAYILAIFTALGALLSYMDGKTDLVALGTALAGAAGIAFARKGASNDVAAHVEEAHPADASTGFGARVSAQRGRASIALLTLLVLGFTIIVGCAAIIPKSHVEADLARHRTISAERMRYVRTGYGPDGKTLTASFMASCEANYAAEDRDVLEELKAAGMVPATATSTSDYVEQ